MTRHRTISERIGRIAAAAAVVFAVSAAVFAGPPVAAVKIRSLVDRPQKNTPVTFGQVFAKGAVPRGMGPRCVVDGGRAQLDVKRHHDDGSVRFAVISTILPELPAKGTKVLSLISAPPRPGPALPPVLLSDLLKTNFDATVTLTFPNGVTRSVSARKLLQQAGKKAATWLDGHVAGEWLVSGPPTDKDGKADEDINVQFQVRAYAGLRHVRVSVVVENCWDSWAGNIRYDVDVAVAGKEVFTRRAVDHRRLSRWRKVFWWGEGRPAVHVMHDPATLSAGGALPNYDRTLPAHKLTKTEQRELQMAGDKWRIMGTGSLTAYMPTTGGRPEIGPYPTWTVRYLLTMTPQSKALVLANGDLAGSWPVHVRARKTGRLMTIDSRPNFWLDGRGRDKPAWKPLRHKGGAKPVRLTPDMAHQPSLAYVPYMVTGDFYYLEEALFWANYCLLNTWPTPRRDARGILSGQIRGNAWALRNLADAEWLAPDGDPGGKYLRQKIANNLADRIRRMYGPPEYSKTGAWGIRTTENARIQNPANPNWMVTAPWETDYLIWSLHHLAELGHAAAAKPRNFLLRLRVGTMTHAPHFNPMLCAPYRFVVGRQGADGKVTFYEDWKTLGRENARLSKPGLQHYGCSYSYSARAAVVCGVDADFPKAAKALTWLDKNLKDRQQVLARNPIWAIVPRGGTDDQNR